MFFARFRGLYSVGLVIGVSAVLFVKAGSPDAVGAELDVLEIQEQLVWAGYLEGTVDRIAGPLTDRAIRRFQGDQGAPQTGNLTVQQMAELNRIVAREKANVGFRVLIDPIGVRIGIPELRVGERSEFSKPRSYGGTWNSPDKKLSIDVFRIPNDSDLAAQKARFSSLPQYKIDLWSGEPDWFFLSGKIGNHSSFYIRAAMQNNEIRGMSVVWSNNSDRKLGATIAAGIAASFVPFPEQRTPPISVIVPPEPVNPPPSACIDGGMNADRNSCIELGDPIVKNGPNPEDRALVYAFTNRCAFGVTVVVAEEGRGRNSISLTGNATKNYECRTAGGSGSSLCKAIRNWEASCSP